MAERAAGEAAECEAMMHEARKGDFLTRAWPSTVRTPRLNETESWQMFCGPSMTRSSKPWRRISMTSSRGRILPTIRN
jgi:hypothetical protein